MKIFGTTLSSMSYESMAYAPSCDFSWRMFYQCEEYNKHNFGKGEEQIDLFILIVYIYYFIFSNFNLILTF